MKFTSDGASLPRWFRRWIKRKYGREIIDLIDSAGFYHDCLTYIYPNTATKNRKLFTTRLREYAIPSELIYMINGGLWAYDHSPKWLQRQLQKTTQ